MKSMFFLTFIYSCLLHGNDVKNDIFGYEKKIVSNLKDTNIFKTYKKSKEFQKKYDELKDFKKVKIQLDKIEKLWKIKK